MKRVNFIYQVAMLLDEQKRKARPVVLNNLYQLSTKHRNSLTLDAGKGVEKAVVDEKF